MRTQRHSILESYKSSEVETPYATAAICETSSRALRSSQPAVSMVAPAAAPPLEKTKSVSLRANFAWTLAGNAIYAACQWGMLVSIAKLGTPAMLGRFAFGLAVTAPVFMLTSLHLRTVLTTDTHNEYRFGHYITPRLLGTAAGLLLIVIVVLLSHFDRDTAVVVVLVGVAKAAETLSDIIYGFWQKHERFDKVAIALTGRGIGSVAAMATALYLTHSIAFATASIALYWFVWLATYERKGAKNLLARVSPEEFLRADWDIAKCRQLVVLSLPLGVAMILLSLNSNIPRYFVEHYWGESALGYFSAMAYVFVLGNTVMVAMGQSAMPRLARYFDSDRPAFTRLLKNMVVLAAVIGILGIGLARLFGSAFLRLVYRADYGQYATVLTWLMGAATFAYVASILGCAMAAARVFRPQVPLILTGTAVTALACWFLIPRLGLAGSAYAVLIGSVFSCTGYAYLVVTSVRSRPRSLRP
jgi:O-antigen/teichoic acid export membrane protein